MQKNNKNKIDYVFLNKINHLLRKNEKVLHIIQTKTPSKELLSRGEYARYKLIATNIRLIILAKSENFEYSESFGYNELKNTVVTRGIFYDFVRIHRLKLKLSKKNSRKFLKLTEFITIKLAIWKYFVFIFLFIIITASAFKGIMYLANNYHLIFFSSKDSNTKQKITTDNKTEQKNQAKEKQKNNEPDKELLDIVKGYEYAFKKLVKNYPVYYKKPSMTGEASSNFDTWIMREVINTLDAQDNKLNSLNLSLEKHVMVKLEIGKLRLLIMRYLDLCKKTFDKPKLRKKLPSTRKKIFQKLKKLRKILK